MKKYKTEEITVLQLGDCIVSLDVLEKKFCCNLSKCKGACCIQGNSGAPLLDEEKQQIEQAYPVFKKYMRPEGIQAVEEIGIHKVDIEGDTVTPLINDEECAYTYFENGICFCAIEKAYFENEIPFRKPVSCHLYPIRIKEYNDFKAVNYDKWEVCKSAVKNGHKKGAYIYEFCKDALIRRFGEEWYNELANVAKQLKNKK